MVKPRVPQELSSGYLKHSAPPKNCDICHKVNQGKQWDIIIQMAAPWVVKCHGNHTNLTYSNSLDFSNVSQAQIQIRNGQDIQKTVTH